MRAGTVNVPVAGPTGVRQMTGRSVEVPTNVFVQRFRAAVGHLPTTLIAAWEQTIEFCESGYHDNLDELRYDMQCRDALEVAFRDGPLQECPQMNWVRNQVAALDLRFRSLLQEDVMVPVWPGAQWWHRHPLKYAGAEAAAEYDARWGIAVEVHDD